MRNQLAGIGKRQRHQLALLLKSNLSIINPKAAATILQIEQHYAAQLLALWTKKGWLSRVKHGVYVPISLQSETTEVMVDEPWLLAKALFDTCYIGGWSASEHWDLTEQIFNSTMVFTTKKTMTRKLDLKGAKFIIKTIKPERNFGSQNVWINGHKVTISDPTKTIVDAFNDPAVMGGIRMSVDVLNRYLKSEYKNMDLLFKYAKQMNNSAIFKRLGFILQRNHPEEIAFVEKISKEIRSNYSQLDPATPGKSLITKWRLWVPSAWKKGTTINDQS